jgi:phosphoribosyl-ATP pyrophosphohydrolase
MHCGGNHCEREERLIQERYETAAKMAVDTGDLEVKTEFEKLAAAMPPFPTSVLATSDPPGYHLSHIEKGILGELSKVSEELAEAIDAEEQGVKVMVLVELSDLLGAIEAYLERYHGGTTLQDLIDMKDVTKRAFKNGRRR